MKSESSIIGHVSIMFTLVMACGRAMSQPMPRSIEFNGAIPRVHDPVMAKDGATYYVFSTGRGIAMHSSPDMKTWRHRGGVFKDAAQWAREAVPGSNDFYWAPDISFFNGKWHLYYSVSTFGSNRSAIGLATNVTLDPGNANYRWKDEGKIVESQLSDNWNAIDPNVVLDEKGQAWLSFGSFWSGIKMRKLNAKTGKTAPGDTELYGLAERPRTPEIGGAVEAPFIVRRGEYYYLFVSFDACCKGIDSTYNIRVGRSRAVTGPYLDRAGKPMREGGGTLVLSGSGRWRGTGHNAVFREGNTDWLVYHAYDAEDNGAAKLRIEPLNWDAQGWPQAPNMKLVSALSTVEKPLLQFDFGSGAAQTGYTKVTPQTTYNKERGYGFDEATGVAAVQRSGPDALRRDFITGDKPFLFHVDLPEGNYNVTLTLGDESGESDTIVKAESRRLMLENVRTAPGKFETRVFTLNVRRPQTKSGETVKLKTEEQQGHFNWDDKLTLEFNGKRTAVCALEIARANDAITIYIAGDSTVTDQKGEPWGAWGQMLPRFFNEKVAIANHAQSGEALFSFKAERRLEKILDTIKTGDYLFIQFGHNDQKDKSPGAGPFTTYKQNLEYYIMQARAKNAIPVLVTPMERRRFNGNEPVQTLTDYAEAVRQVAKEQNVALIDLHATSLKFYAALGPEKSKRAFVHYAAGTFPGQAQALKDDTHFNAYGAYQLARGVAEGIKANVPALASFLRNDVTTFDAAQPDDVDKWSLPASPVATAAEKPAGN